MAWMGRDWSSNSSSWAWHGQGDHWGRHGQDNAETDSWPEENQEERDNLLPASGKKKEKDRFENCTTLGLKHPVPLDERKELLLELMALGSPDTTFPRIGLFNWGPRTVHAAFMILCRAEPQTAFRSLLNRDSKIYDRHWAAQVLFQDFEGLYPEGGIETAGTHYLAAEHVLRRR